MTFEQKGIDVSSWQGAIDWPKVKEAGIQFAMIRAAVSTHTDKDFVRNLKGAQAAGIDCGVYLYSYANTVQDSLQEANHLLQLLRPYKLQFPVAFDVEDKVQRNLSKTQRTDVVESFCQQVAEADYQAMVYSSLYWFEHLLDLSRLKNYDKWVAQWGVSKPTYKGSLQMWQSTNKGIVKGINGFVDLDRCYVDYAGRGSVEQPIAPPPDNQVSLEAGIELDLTRVPLYVSSTAIKPVSYVSGHYWIYDGIAFGKRMRLTNRAERVGKRPLNLNVSGYANISDLQAALS